MAFTIQTTQLLPVPAQVAFDRLADHDSWPGWMPPSYRPVGATLGRLSEGQTFRVKILGLPFGVSCKVSVVRSPTEITWMGGTKGVLWAEHRFLFEARGAGGVQVQSTEVWEGFLTVLLRRSLSFVSTKVLREQLNALEKATSLSP